MILIIGGTSGIGWAVARQYAEAGQQVLVCGRDLAKLPNPMPESIANNVQAVACDITDLGASPSAICAVVDGSIGFSFGECGFLFSR